MNRGNSGQIKIRKKQSFRPIMLTSKSIKPVERSNIDKVKIDSKNDITQVPIIRRKHTHNFPKYASSINKAQMIKKLANQYRQQLIRNIQDQANLTKNRNKKPITASIIQVQFDSDQALLNRSHSRYENLMCKLNSSEMKDVDLKKSMNCPNSKFQHFLNFTRPKLNHSAGFNSLSRSQSSKQNDQWSRCFDKYYLNVKKIHPQKKNSLMQGSIPQDKMIQISAKVQQYQNTLLKKMKQRLNLNSSCLDNISEDDVSLSPGRRSPDKKQLTTDQQKIQDDMITKRQINKKQHFVFGMAQTTKVSTDQINKQKFEAYKDFLWKINFTNSLYVRLKDQIQIPYKLFVGPGNNSMLIKGIMRRRFWWQIIQKPNQQANFIWTQIKINQYFTFQNIHLKTHNKKHSVILRMRKTQSALQHTNLVNSQQSNQFEIDSIIKINRKKQQVNQQKQLLEIDNNSKIFKGRDYHIWKNHIKVNKKFEQKQENLLSKRIKTMTRKKTLLYIDESKKIKIQNHFQCNYFLGNKKALFYSLKKYYTLLKKDPFDYIPLTFHISKGLQDPQYAIFLEKYQEFQQKKKNKQIQNIWIVKPGEMTNRGRGITVCSILDDVKIRLKSKQKAKNGQPHTYIVQKYIEKPLLYNKRKFDIRHYMMMTCVNGKFKGYWYEQGYLRTTSTQYNMKNCKDLYTHLTNDAIQKYSADYGKFQKGNKVSYADFQKYLNGNYRPKGIKNIENDKYNFFGTVLPKMRSLATDAMKATYMLLSPQRYEHNFELFGLDFMLDEDMNVYLIQVNTNPCLQTSCPLLSKLISSVVQNVFKICVDPLFPPPYQWPTQRKMQMGDNALQQNKFTLVFDENQDGQELMRLYQNGGSQLNNMGLIDQEDEYYQDEGKQWVQQQTNK